jgi:hypothetical protein
MEVIMSKWILLLRRIHLHSVGKINRGIPMKLKQFAISGTNWLSVLEGAGIAAGGAVLTYVAQNIGNIDFGTYTPMVVALASVGINYLRKVLANIDPTNPPEPPPAS